MQDVTPFARDGESVAAEKRGQEPPQRPEHHAKVPAAGEGIAEKGKAHELTTSITMAGLFDKYPYLKEFFVSLSPAYAKLKNPVVFAAMGRIATLAMAAQRGGFEPDELLARIKEEIEKHENR